MKNRHTQFHRPRCPFAIPGLAAREAMTGCPGYLAQILPAGGRVDSDARVPVAACWHLAADQIAPGRFIPGCYHPEADRVVEGARIVLDHARLPLGVTGLG